MGVAILEFETASTAPYTLFATHLKGLNSGEYGNLSGEGVNCESGFTACVAGTGEALALAAGGCGG